MDELPVHIDNNIDKLADDSTLYTSGHNVEEIQHSLQTNLNAVTTWCEDKDKSKTILVIHQGKQTRKHWHPHPESKWQTNHKRPR